MMRSACRVAPLSLRDSHLAGTPPGDSVSTVGSAALVGGACAGTRRARVEALGGTSSLRGCRGEAATLPRGPRPLCGGTGAAPPI